MNGAELIAAERQRQIDAEGWTPDHDDEHGGGELADAAFVYLWHVTTRAFPTPGQPPRLFWPWAPEWYKPSDDPVRNLVKAGALIAAEIDRLERSAS